MCSARNVLRDAYRESLARHRFVADAAQLHAVARLDDLRMRLRERDHRGWIGRLGAALRSRTDAERTLDAQINPIMRPAIATLNHAARDTATLNFANDGADDG